MHKQLIDLCLSNAAFFENDTSKRGQCLRALFLEMKEHVTFSVPLLEEIRFIAPQHDFDVSVPANGYRSALSAAEIVMSGCILLNEQIENKRKSLLFPKRKFKREMEIHTQMMKGISTLMLVLATLVKRSEGELIFTKCQSLEEFFRLCDMNELTCFFGKYIGYQFCKSVRFILRYISVGMAAYNEVYHSKRNKVLRNLHWVWSGGRYVLDSNLRAQKVLDITQYTSIDFCKSFWMITENDLVSRATSIVCPRVAVNQIINIPVAELVHVNADGSRIQIPIPHSHCEPAPVRTRLLSTVRREGMDGSRSAAPRSRHLVFHCHGGGFVSQGSRSHEIYLRDWTKKLDMPILSVDYSLAPAAPYPRALEEVLYSYAWALANASRLGTTAEYVIFSGDSAGANLVLCLGLKCIELGLTPPLGIFLAYVPVLLTPAPSPARSLSVTDPIVPFGVMLNCMQAYAGHTNHCPSAASSSSAAVHSTVQVEKSCDGKTSLNEVEEPVNPVDMSCTVNGGDSCVKTVVVHVESKSSIQLDADHHVKMLSESPVNNFVAHEVLPSAEKYLKDNQPNPFSLFIAGQNMNDSKDPFMSPYWASSEALSQLPPVSIVTVEFDPCLDDCVWFARRLKNLGNAITLDVLSGLPHGFLNIAMLNKKCLAASDLCVRRMKEFFQTALEVEVQS